MNIEVLLLVIVVLPCVFTVGVLVGYDRGRRDAEDDFAASFSVHAQRR